MDEGMRGMAPREGVSCESLDAELRAALDVDPSPEFLARVRTRIAAEPASSRWRLAWLMVPAVATSLAALALALFPLREVVPPAAPMAPTRAVAPSRVAPLAASPAARSRVGPRRTRQPARTIEAARAFPEVVISEDEQRAFEALLAASRRGMLPVRVLSETGGEESLPPLPLDIEDLVVEPLQLTRLE